MNYYVRFGFILLFLAFTTGITQSSNRFKLSRSEAIHSTEHGISLSSYVPVDQPALLHLTFDSQTPAFLRDLTGNFATGQSHFLRSTDSKIAGQSSAFFNRRESVVALKSNRNVWPPADRDPESFFLSFWFQPVHLYKRNSLFRYTVPGMRTGAGLFLEIRDGRIVLEGRNVVFQENSVRSNIHLVSRTILKKDKWYHILLQYRKDLPGFTLIINGKEDSTVSFNRKDSLLSFPEEIQPQMILGNPLSGRMDELVMGNGHLTQDQIKQLSSVYGVVNYDDRSGRIYQNRGVGYSKVIALKDNYENGMIHYKANEPPGTLVVVRYRASTKKFQENTPESILPYKLIQPGKPAKLDSFRYIQWMTELKADPEGQKSPELRAVEVSGNPYHMPVRPERPEIIEDLSNENRFCIQWRKNPELSIEKSGGYVILVGVRKNEFLAKLDQFAGKPIRKNTTEFPLTESEKELASRKPREIERLKQKHIRYCIDQSVMNTAILLDPEKERLPYIESMRSYYLSVGAYIRSTSHTVQSDSIIHTIRPDR